VALEPIETAQLWVATVAGLAGLAGLFWQIFIHFAGRRQGSNRALNAGVLRPWSEVRVDSIYDSEQHNRIALVIPTEAIPPPLTMERGLEVQRLPGLSKGVSFVRKRYPAVFALWAEALGLSEKHATLLQRRRATVEPIVLAGMRESYPSLSPVHDPWGKEYTMNTYVPSRLVADIESSGYWAVGGTELRVRVQMQKTQVDNVIHCEYRAGSNPWLKVREEDALDENQRTERMTSWIQEPSVHLANKELFDCLKELETTIDRFRIALKEVSINVELEGE